MLSILGYIILGQKTTYKDFRKRFFTYSTDQESLRKDFDNDLRSLLLNLPEVIKESVVDYIKHYAKEAKKEIGKRLLSFREILTEREKKKEELRKIEENEPQRIYENECAKEKIIKKIKELSQKASTDITNGYNKIISRQSKLSCMMRIVYKEEFADGGQGPVGGVEEGVGGLVVLRADPFALEDAPQGPGEVEVRRVRREEEKEEPPSLPHWPQLLDGVAAVDRGVVEHDEGVPCPGLEGEPVEEPRDLGGGDALGGREPVVVVFPVNHAEDVEAGYPLRGDVHLLPGQLPAASRRGRTLPCRRGSRRRSRGLCGLQRPVVQVLAASQPCTRRAAARASPLGVSLYAYILRQCG